MEWLENGWYVLIISFIVVGIMLWKVHREHCGQNRRWFEEWEDWHNNKLTRWEDYDNNNFDA